jgi:hypothetical protein
MDDKDRLLQNLVDSKIIHSELLPDDASDPIDADSLYKMLVGGFDLFYDQETERLYYIDSDGDRVNCPDMAAGMSNSASWVSDHLPLPNMDLDQGGSVRKGSEVRALYTIVCIGGVFVDLKDEIVEFINSYNFLEFIGKAVVGEEDQSAVSYLKTFTDLNSIVINCVVSAASIKLTQIQEKKSAFWRSNLTRVETLGLSKISRDIKSVILRFEKDHSLNPVDVKNLSKIEKLTTIEKRDLEIEKIINESQYSTLYRITKFNSERLSPVSKRRIFHASRKIAEAEVLNSGVTNKLAANELFDKTFYEMQRSLSRKAVSTLISAEIDKYKKAPLEYKFLKKI